MTYNEFDILFEAASPRIQHLEDLVFWEGSAGLTKAVQTLKQITQSGHKNATVKWDGSPAIVFGRDEQGNFILTDKSGFTAKGYDGKAKSAEDLMQMFMNRAKGKPSPDYKKFAIKMASIFPVIERAVPEDFRGFFKADLLYYSTPPVQDDHFIFQPNVVQYAVRVDSHLGQLIADSETGAVIHKQTDTAGEDVPLDNLNDLQTGEFLPFMPVVTQSPVILDNNVLSMIVKKIRKYGPAIDKMLDEDVLRTMKMASFPQVLYTYTNQQVDANNLNHLGDNFLQWLSKSKVSAAGQIKMEEYIKKHSTAFKQMWSLVKDIAAVKDNAIEQFDSQELDIKQSMQDQPGGEGYVYSHPDTGDIKFVPRQTFSAINRAIER